MTTQYNITSYGNLINTNGVLSNFSTSNYVTLPISNNLANDNFEVIIKFNISLNSNDSQVLWCVFDNSTLYPLYSMCIDAHKLYFETTTGTAQILEIVGSSTISLNTDYYVRLVRNNNTYTLSLSTDGVNWTTEGTSTNNNYPTYTNAIHYLGLYTYNDEGTQYFEQILDGEIDLNGSYITLGNTPIWKGVTNITRIQLRHDTTANWTSVNPILLEGEVGIETDTLKQKVGDGVTAWNSLSYMGSSGGSTIPPIAYGTSTTAAATVQKEVSIPAITELNVGQVIMIRPSTTSTVANSTIKLNSFDAYQMRYNNAAITTSTDSIVWNASYVSQFVFDGTYWQFLGHGLDSNTTYSAMAVSEGTTGTATNARTLSAANLKGIIQGTKLTGLDTSDNSAVEATDNILTGIGKLQAEVNNTIPADAVNYLLNDKEDVFDIQSPLTMIYTLNGDGSLESSITMNSDGTLTTGNPDDYWGFDEEFGTLIPQTAYWEFNFKFKRISTTSTTVPFFGVADGAGDEDINFVELYLQNYNIPQDTWVQCSVIHQAGASDIQFEYTVNDTTTTVQNVLVSDYTLSANKYVEWMGLGISEVFSLDWNTYYKTSPTDVRHVFTDRTLGCEDEIYLAKYGVTTYSEITNALANYKTVICKDGNRLYYYIRAVGGYSFGSSFGANAEYIFVDSNSTWSRGSIFLANKDLSNVTSINNGSAVQTALDAKVNKSGDTMTGGLSIDTDDNNRRACRIDNISTTAERDIEFNATSASHRVGAIRGALSSDGTTCLMTFGCCNPNNDALSGLQINRTNTSISCTFPNTTCVDGQWIITEQDIISTAVSLNGSSDLSYTVNLPNDGHIYEVMIRADANTGNILGNWFIVGVKTNILTNSYVWVCGTATQAARTAGSQGTVIVPMRYGTNNLYLRRNTNYNGSTALKSLCYRRVGTNA